MPAALQLVEVPLRDTGERRAGVDSPDEAKLAARLLHLSRPEQQQAEMEAHRRRLRETFG